MSISEREKMKYKIGKNYNKVRGEPISLPAAGHPWQGRIIPLYDTRRKEYLNILSNFNLKTILLQPPLTDNSIYANITFKPKLPIGIDRCYGRVFLPDFSGQTGPSITAVKC